MSLSCYPSVDFSQKGLGLVSSGCSRNWRSRRLGRSLSFRRREGARCRASMTQSGNFLLTHLFDLVLAEMGLWFLMWFLVNAVDVRSSGSNLGVVKISEAATKSSSSQVSPLSSSPVSVSSLMEFVSDDLQRLNKNLQTVSYLFYACML